MIKLKKPLIDKCLWLKKISKDFGNCPLQFFVSNKLINISENVQCVKTFLLILDVQLEEQKKVITKDELEKSGMKWSADNWQVKSLKNEETERSS